MDPMDPMDPMEKKHLNEADGEEFVNDLVRPYVWGMLWNSPRGALNATLHTRGPQ
jgi:hypothetical protein